MSAITLDDVLFNRKPEPFTLRALFAYLEQNLATELLDFWVTALDLRNMFEPEHPRSSYSINNWDIPEEEQGSVPEGSERPRSLTHSVRVKLEALEKAKATLKKRYTESQILVIQTYVADDSALCINISDEQRHSILARAPKSLDDDPTPGLFDDAMGECEKLITQNYWSSFISLAEQHAKKRATLATPAPPPPKPRPSQVIKKGHILSKEEIAKLVPKEPPPPDEVA